MCAPEAHRLALTADSPSAQCGILCVLISDSPSSRSLQRNIRKWTGTIKRQSAALDGAALGVRPSRHGIKASLAYQQGIEGSPAKQGWPVVTAKEIDEVRPSELKAPESPTSATKTTGEIVAPPSPQEFQRRCSASAMQPASLEFAIQDDGGEADLVVVPSAAAASMTDTLQAVPIAGVVLKTTEPAEDSSGIQEKAADTSPEEEMEISRRHRDQTPNQDSPVCQKGGVKAALMQFEDAAPQESFLHSATTVSPRHQDVQDPQATSDPNMSVMIPSFMWIWFHAFHDCDALLI